jgi:hypothetical protein
LPVTGYPEIATPHVEPSGREAGTWRSKACLSMGSRA